MEHVWIVVPIYNRPGIMDYVVMNSRTGEKRGTFDCHLWAQEFADQLNREEVQLDETAKAGNL